MKIFQYIKSIANNNIPALLIKICNTINNIVSVIKKWNQKKEQKETEKKIKYNNKVIDDVCDNGTINDLLNLKNMTKSIILVSLMAFSGCQTISINTVKQWEGHYTSIQELSKAVSTIKLDKKESVWILSNETLKNILKEQNRK